MLILLHPSLSLLESSPPDEFFESVFSRRLHRMGRRIFSVSSRKKLSGNDEMGEVEYKKQVGSEIQ